MNQFPAFMHQVVDLVEIWLERFVQWNVEHEWIGSKSLLLVTPGEGLDAKAIELADAISFDVATMKVAMYTATVLAAPDLLPCWLDLAARSIRVLCALPSLL